MTARQAVGPSRRARMGTRRKPPPARVPDPMVLCDGVCDAVVLSLFEKMRASSGSPACLARQRRKVEGGMTEMARLVGQQQ